MIVFALIIYFFCNTKVADSI